MSSQDSRETTSKSIALQDVADGLLRFWSEAGCRWLPACDLPVPAAILHPEHLFRLLAPVSATSGSWHAVCAQPVLRPLDARGGAHPFRLGRHLEIQAILRGDGMEDARSLLLRSLEALGVDLAARELRFTEYRLSALSLDLRGAGWQVLIDGLAVARLIALDQIAGQKLEPPAWEVTYGVERLGLALGAASDIYALGWTGDEPRDGAERRRDEAERLRWSAELADADVIGQHLALRRMEAERALAAGLWRRAYELIVRSIADVDLLDTRGELSGREREGLLRQIGEVVRRAAELAVALPEETAVSTESAEPPTPGTPTSTAE